MDGRRMLPPTRSVFWPLWAIVSARLTIVVVLPSWSVGLVATSTLPPPRSWRAEWVGGGRGREAPAPGGFGSEGGVSRAWLRKAPASTLARPGRRALRR